MSPETVPDPRADFAERAARTRVDGLVSDRVHALPEGAPISHAIAVMAFENVNEVAVVADDGKVVGVVTANDALRWTARQLGYVMGSPEEER